MEKHILSVLPRKKTLSLREIMNLEGISGIYEQLTPLQFHFIEKPAQILQIPSFNLNVVSDIIVYENRSSSSKNRKIRQNEVNLTKNGKNCDFRRVKMTSIWRKIGKIAISDENFVKTKSIWRKFALNKLKRFHLFTEVAWNQNNQYFHNFKFKEGICKICAGFSMKWNWRGVSCS